MRFLRALGRAYRESGRRTPIMDALSFHPYPNENTHEPGRGYTWSNVGVPHLSRLKQAAWDAFGGTAQPTFEEGLTVDLDEVAWQVDTSGRGDYTGAENVPTIDEPTQARYYAEVVRFFACDPSVSSMSFFHFVDELDRDRFQSGVLRRDGSRRESFEAVRRAIAETGGRCTGQPVVWRHTTSVVGGEADFGTLAPSSFKRTAYNLRATADEEALYRAGIFPVAGRVNRGAIVSSLASAGAPRPVGTAAGTTLGLRRNVISVTWDAERPVAPPREAAQIQALLPVAARSGVRVVFAVYGASPTTFTGSPLRRAQLASWLAALARRHPTVKEYIGPTEPNQPRFWQPQFTPACANASGAAYAEVMGAMYDALKGVDRGIRVVGVGLSPRGNDSCRAPDNVSIHIARPLPPRARARVPRNRPLMDGLAVHVYPNLNTDPPGRGYRWPNIGAPNLPRLEQAFWDAFGGTAQPTFEEGLRVDLEGVGWQVDTREREDYHGLETVPPVSEAKQAEYYAWLVRSVSCDASVASLTIFHLVDEADRDRFQTGLLRVDGSRRPSFGAVRAAVARNGRCRGAPTSWRHRTSVVGTRVDFGGLAPSWSRRRYWSFHAYAAEGVSYRAGVYRFSGGRPGSGARVLAMRGEVPAYYNVLVRARRQRLRPGRYVYAIMLRAETNPERTNSFVSDPFVVR